MSENRNEAIQEMLAGIYIQNLRIYDILMTSLALQNPEKADALEKMHSEGKVLGPDPALSIED
jgi:hypothetical protein